MMETYKIVINEQLQRTEKIEAENYEDAIQNVINKYKNEEIILTADDYLTTNIDVDYDENFISKLINIGKFKEYLNDEINNIILNCTTEKLIQFAFGNLENAIKRFQIEYDK